MCLWMHVSASGTDMEGVVGCLRGEAAGERSGGGARRIREPALMTKPAYVYCRRSPLASCSWLGWSAAAARQDYTRQHDCAPYHLPSTERLTQDHPS